MPRFRECPYCHTVYRYKDIIGMKGKINECYRCKKPFRKINAYRIIIIAAACVLMVGVNLFLMFSDKNLSTATFRTMIILDAAVITLAFVIAPMMVSFRGLDKKQIKKLKKK